MADKIVKTFRTDKTGAFRRSLGFNVALEAVKDAFKEEDMQTKYSVLGYITDLNFQKHKLAIEVDELGYSNRNIDYEIERQ